MEDRKAMPTEAMVEAFTESWELNSHLNTPIRVREALSAALAHPGQVREIAIKPLEWTPVVADGRDIQAQTEFGLYVISVDSSFAGGTHYLWTPDQREYDDDHHSEHRGMTSAKAAAQADFEQRIRSALALPLPVQEPGGEICPRLGLPHQYWPQGNCQYCGSLRDDAAYPSIPEEKGGTAESVVGIDPFKPPCPQCSWIETNLGTVLDKTCDLHQKIGDMQADLVMTRQLDANTSRMLRMVCEVIGAHDDDDPIEVAKARMEEITALEDELDAASPTEGQTVKEGSTNE